MPDKKIYIFAPDENVFAKPREEAGSDDRPDSGGTDTMPRDGCGM